MQNFHQYRFQRTWKKPAAVSLCPPQIPRTEFGSYPERRDENPATNCLSYGRAWFFRIPMNERHSTKICTTVKENFLEVKEKFLFVVEV
jgi:hypothetical protein